MFGKLSTQEIEILLSSQTLARIGCHATGKTHIVPISYVYFEKIVYCHTHEGLKINMMRENPSICFEVDTLENGTIWKSVIAQGRFEEITDVTKRNIAIQKLLNGMSPFAGNQTIKMELGNNFPFAPKDFKEIGGIVFRIFLEEKTGRFERMDTVTYQNVLQ